MNLRKIIRRYFWFLLAAMLVACQPQKGDEVGASTPNIISATQTLTAFPTVTPSPTELLPFPLDGYMVVFQKEGDLYFQDENNSPIQSTQGGKANWPVLSDDNQKIIFNLGDASENGYSNIYSVSVDGSNKQALVTEQWLAAFGEGTSARYPTFVPNSHLLIFNTYQCETQDYRSPCLIGLYLADIDTDVIKEILSPRNFDQYNHDRNFQISPDGKMVSVFMSGHIDIFDMEGKIIRQNILSYTPSTPVELFPSQYWLPDSSGLIVAIPDAINFGWAYPIYPTYSVWIYKIISGKAEKIPLEPSPILIYEGCGDVISVSPDGNWILYPGLEDYAIPLHLGSLINNQIQSYAPIPCPSKAASWSSDSKYFAYGDYYIGSFDKSPIPIGPIHSSFLRWIDANHFIYIFYDIEANKFQTNIGELVGDTVKTYYASDPYWIIKPK